MGNDCLFSYENKNHWHRVIFRDGIDHGEVGERGRIRELLLGFSGVKIRAMGERSALCVRMLPAGFAD